MNSVNNDENNNSIKANPEVKIQNIVLGRVGTNCYLVTTEKTALLIDTSEKGREITDAVLSALGDKPLDAIITTHGHWDHICGAPILIKETGAKLIAYEDELEQIGYGLDNTPKSKLLFKGVDQTVTDGELLRVGDIEFKIMHTPGHTSGSMCLYLESEGILFSGDTLFFHSHGRTDFYTGNDADMRESLNKLSKLPLDTVVLAGHNQPTSIKGEQDFAFTML